jgi:enterochelin esterase-like enzyme
LLAAAALVLIACGVAGAYSYGRDYYVHRGFATLANLPRAGRGRLLHVTFYSPSLHRQADYLVYLPPGYNVARRYPVYYLLHGAPGRPAVFIDIANMDVRLDNQLSLGTVRPMILVYPDGRIGGSTYSDSEWANTPSGQLESYVLDVVHNVDHQFSTVPYRQDRVIAGFSAGAYGAINIALHHVATFASVQVWSGYFTQTRSGVFATSSPATLRYNSPIDEAPALRAQIATDGLRVFMFVGRDDESSRQIVPMARVLRTAGATVRYDIVGGGHDWSVWYPRLNQMLISASSATRRLPPHGLQALPRIHTGARARPTVRTPAGQAGPLPGSAPAARVARSPEERSGLLLTGALVLSLVGAALINLGFVLQHRGLSALSARSGGASVLSGLRSSAWLAGQTVGWIGFAAQIVAVAIAPLALVQAFAAGSLAVTVPVAARVFGHPVRRAHLLTLALVAVSLFMLPIGFSHRHDHLLAGALIDASLVTALVAASLAARGPAAARAIAAGLFYGIADAAIKADAIGLAAHGTAALESGWTATAAAATFAGFIAFQAALRDEHAINTIALMTAFTALAALCLGILSFGESLGTSAEATAAHLAAIMVVLACVVPLARIQQRLGQAGAGRLPAGGSSDVLPDGGGLCGHAGAGRVWLATLLRTGMRGLARTARVLAAGTVLVLCAVVGTGLLYSLRGLNLLSFGPSIPDSLPLLQLAGFDAQPAVRVAVAWLAAGVVLGLALALLRVAPARRPLLTALAGALLLVLGSDASSALARNLNFHAVLVGRVPRAGTWLEALLLAAGAGAPSAVARVRPLAAALTRECRRHAQQVAESLSRPDRVTLVGRLRARG